MAQFTANGGNATPPADVTTQYTITAEDAAGPFDPQLPTDMMEMSKVPALTYRTLLETLAERFHAAPELLQRLNPGARFEANEMIVVPNVAPMVLPVERVKFDPAAAAWRAAECPTRRGAGRSRHLVDDARHHGPAGRGGQRQQGRIRRDRRKTPPDAWCSTRR